MVSLPGRGQGVFGVVLWNFKIFFEGTIMYANKIQNRSSKGLSIQTLNTPIMFINIFYHIFELLRFHSFSEKFTELFSLQTNQELFYQDRGL